MGKHFQTILEANRGNALQACIATLLDAKELADVPNFIELPNYMEGLNKFLENNFPKLAFVKVDLSNSSGALTFPVAPGTRCVLTGKSPRGDHKHCVVAKVAADGASFTIEHDPHPEGGDVVAPLAWAGFICLK